MDELFKKYRNDMLSAGELQELRQKVQSMSDEELAAAIFNDWENCDGAEIETKEETKERILASIHEALEMNRSKKRRSTWNIVRNIAAALLPVALLCAALLYFRPADAGSTVVSTNHAEHATVLLPDGTTVELGSDSRLEYDAAQYARDRRHVVFSGVAYFDVCRNEERPFTVGSEGLRVTVLGTKFNLNARHSEEADAVLFLKEGSVEFRSELTGARALVEPGQKVTMNYSNGNIDVSEPGANENIMAWRTHRLQFVDEELSTVIATIERYYGRKIIVEGASIDNQQFTGTIPTDNMDLSIGVIERIFKVKLRVAE